MNKIIAVLLVSLIIYACATVQAPVGGEKDTKPPKLYESNPAHQSTNFEGKTVRLFFNEWMKVENLQKELIITPRTNIEFEHTLKKQELIIEFEQPLKDSTTYTFNFRDALKDITEGNVWKEPVLAFSTGNYLDSLKIQGTIIDLKTKKPAENHTVALYDATYDTANLRQGQPLYFTTTDEKGLYTLQNLRPDKYLLYTFNDKNDNLQNESSKESYGFYPKVLQLSDSVKEITLNTYKSNEDTLDLKQARATAKDFVITFNKGIEHYSIVNPNDSTQHIYANTEENASKLKIYKENFPDLAFQDSLLLTLQIEDSIGMSLTDSVYALFRESRIANEEFKIVGSPDNKILSGAQQLTYSTNKPVHLINTDSILLKYDSLIIRQFQRQYVALSQHKKDISIKFHISQKEIDSIQAVQKAKQDSIASEKKDTSIKSDTLNPAQQNTNEITENTEGAGLKMAGPAAPPKKQNVKGLHIYLGKAAFVGIENDSSVMTTTTLSFKQANDYGIIKGTVQNPPENYIIELINSEYKVIDTLINVQDFTFSYVKPGDYYLRAIIDRNANKEWDPGNPLTLTPEEAIILMEEKITVKANWEVIDQKLVLPGENDVDNATEK